MAFWFCTWRSIFVDNICAYIMNIVSAGDSWKKNFSQRFSQKNRKLSAVEFMKVTRAKFREKTRCIERMCAARDRLESKRERIVRKASRKVFQATFGIQIRTRNVDQLFPPWNGVPSTNIYLPSRAVSAKISFLPGRREKTLPRMSDLHNFEGVSRRMSEREVEDRWKGRDRKEERDEKGNGEESEGEGKEGIVRRRRKVKGREARVWRQNERQRETEGKSGTETLEKSNLHSSGL